MASTVDTGPPRHAFTRRANGVARAHRDHTRRRRQEVRRAEEQMCKRARDASDTSAEDHPVSGGRHGGDDGGDADDDTRAPPEGNAATPDAHSVDNSSDDDEPSLEDFHVPVKAIVCATRSESDAIVGREKDSVDACNAVLTSDAYDNIPFPLGVHVASDFENVHVDKFTRDTLFSTYQSRGETRASDDPPTNFFLEELRDARDVNGDVLPSMMYARFSGFDDFAMATNNNLPIQAAQAIAGSVLYYVTRSKLMRPVVDLCNRSCKYQSDLPLVSSVDCFCGNATCQYQWNLDDQALDEDGVVVWDKCSEASSELRLCKTCSRIYHAQCAEFRKEEDGSSVCLACRPLEWGCHCKTLLHFEETEEDAVQWVICEDCGRSCHLSCVAIPIGEDGYRCKDEGKSCCTHNPNLNPNPSFDGRAGAS